MKKTIYILCVFLASCSKNEDNINYKSSNLDRLNSTYNIIKSGNTINIDIKENDSTFRGFALSQLNNNKNCSSYYKTIRKGKVSITILESGLIGSHTISNGYITGKYTSKNSSDFIEFKNYQL